MKKKKIIHITFLALLPMLILISCSGGDNNIPRPKGYFRITFPQKKYQQYKGDCPVTFEYPDYCKIEHLKSSQENECWFNIEFPRFDAKLHFSYFSLKYYGLDKCLHDSHELAYKHTVKATDIEETAIRDSARDVYGLIYDIEGNAASNYQFFLTDSTNNFLRASLYFYRVPNADSLKPVIKFVKKDAAYFIKTLRWAKNDAAQKPLQPAK